MKNQDEIRVRPGQREDLPAVHELVGELAAYERAAHEFTATIADYYRDFDAGVFEILVAERQSEVAGMALYYMTYSTWKGKMLYLEDFVVKRTFRRQGIGRRLFDAFLEEAKKQECRMVKWQVLDWNQPALDFYRQYEATIEKEWWNGKLFFRAGS